MSVAVLDRAVSLLLKRTTDGVEEEGGGELRGGRGDRLSERGHVRCEELLAELDNGRPGDKDLVGHGILLDASGLEAG